MADDHQSHDGKAPAERAVELMVYAPIGLALFARDMVPPLLQQFVARGRAEVDQLQKRVETQVSNARVLGQFAVAQGPDQLRRLAEQQLDQVRERAEQVARAFGVTTPTVPTVPPAPSPGAGEAAGTARTGVEGADRRREPASVNGRAAAAPGAERRDASGLPIPDYDELSASQVVARLSGLSAEELEQVREYEASQRARKTVLGKIAQLSG